MHVINHFQHYSTNYQAFIHTNHSSIQFLMDKLVTNGRATSWLLLLQEFNIIIVDKPGKYNVFADFLSRLTNSSYSLLVEDSFPY